MPNQNKRLAKAMLISEYLIIQRVFDELFMIKHNTVIESRWDETGHC